MIATGGSPKAPKCHAEIAGFKFVQGTARIKKKSTLPCIPITVQGKNGEQSNITLIEPIILKKTLGVRTNLAGDGTGH